MPTKPKRTCKAGSNFATALDAHGISNNAIADVMGCHCSTITGWRYRGVPAHHAQLAANFLHVKTASITSSSKRKSKPFAAKRTDVVIAGKPTTKRIVDTITINGDSYVRTDDVRDVIEAAIEVALTRMYG
jgi:hypothetical protein